MRSLSPLVWYGGKQRLAKRIVGLLPNHETYVEVFGGSGAVLFAKSPSPVEVYNDRFSEVYNFFCVLRDQVKSKRLKEDVWLTPYARDEHQAALMSWKSGEMSQLGDLERARRFFILVRMSFGGKFAASFGYAKLAQGGKSGATMQSVVDRLDEFAARIRDVTIENRDFRELLPQFNRRECCIYADPPYLHETRRKVESCYQHEMSADDHCDLLDLLLATKSRVIVSGYASPLYDQRLKRWARLEIETRETTSNHRGKAAEVAPPSNRSPLDELPAAGAKLPLISCRVHPR